MRSVRLVLVAITLLGSAAALAHGDAIEPGELDFKRAPADTLPWGYLAKVGVQVVDGRVVPEFLAPVRALDRTRVILFGYATAVDRNTTNTRYLLTPRPIFCPGCERPLGPEGIVEVNFKRPIVATAHPIAVRGTLRLLQDDPKNVLYRMTDAAVVVRGLTGPRRRIKAAGTASLAPETSTGCRRAVMAVTRTALGDGNLHRRPLRLARPAAASTESCPA